MRNRSASAIAAAAVAAGFLACKRPSAVGSIPAGRSLYHANGCAACHGLAGRGDGPAARGAVVRPRDFSNRRDFRFGHTLEDIVRTLKTGIPASGMPTYSYLTSDERGDLAVFIVSLADSAKAERNP